MRRRVFVAAFSLAVVAGLIPVRALCDSQLAVVNQTTVEGTLQPVTESEVITFSAPAAAAIKVRCAGRGAFLPRIVLTPPGGPDVVGSEGSTTSTLNLTAESTGVHLVRIVSRNENGGDYSLRVRWTPRSRFAGPGIAAGMARAFTFSADTGSVASISVKSAPGAAPFVPGITAVAGPGSYGTRELTGRRSDVVELGEAGDYTVMVDDGPEDADVEVTVRLRSRRTPPQSIDISSAVIGNGGARVQGDFVVGQAITADGGLVAVDVPTNLGGGAFDLAGTSVLIPPSALPSTTTIVVGSSKPVRENRGARNLGATVYFAPEGTKFGTPDAPQKALVTIPVTQSVLKGDPTRIRLTTRDERGRVSDVRFTQEEKDAGFPDFLTNPGFVTFPVSHFSSYAATLGKVSPEDPVDNLQYGGNMSASSNGLIVGARSAAYVYEVEDGQVTFDAKLVGSGIDVQDEFGYSCALEGDIAVVSAPHPNQDFELRAAVFVFRRVRGVWTEQAKLSTPEPTPMLFGLWVAVSRGQVFVGAPALSRVYVYEETKLGWAVKQVIVAGDDLGRSAASFFGTLVAVDGDTMIVGAPYRDERRGAVYVFTRSDGTWTERALLTVDGAVPGDEISRGPGNGSATISGDTIVIGAASRASAIVFRGSGANWALEQEIEREDGDLPSFGSAVGHSGDQLLIGAIDGDFNSGAVYLYRRSGTTWTRSDSFVPPVHRPNDFFGSQPTFLGANLVAVGANYDVPESSGIRSGSIYLFELESQ